MVHNIIDETKFERLPLLLKQTCACGTTAEQKHLLFLSTIGVVSGVVDCKVVYDGLPYRPNLFVVVVAPAASGKSLMKLPLILLEGINEERRQTGKTSLTISANTSSAGLYEDLAANGGAGVILETEIDTLSAAMNQDWGNFGDVLRKAFGQESISVKRSNKARVEIADPKFSLVLSGTPRQLAPLVGSVENGLFSRILPENLVSEFKWRRVMGKAGKEDFSEQFKQLSESYKNFIHYSNDNPFELVLTEEQWEILNSYFDSLTVANKAHDPLRATIFRIPIICLKVLLVLAAFRRYERHCHSLNESSEPGNNEQDPDLLSEKHQAKETTQSTLTEHWPEARCDMNDFLLVMELAASILYHAKKVAQGLPSNAPVGIKASVWTFYNQLPNGDFTMDELLEMWGKNKSSERTFYRYLDDLTPGFVEKLPIGWRKVSANPVVTNLTNVTLSS
jgi:hypothetical protein